MNIVEVIKAGRQATHDTGTTFDGEKFSRRLVEVEGWTLDPMDLHAAIAYINYGGSVRCDGMEKYEYMYVSGGTLKCKFTEPIMWITVPDMDWFIFEEPDDGCEDIDYSGNGGESEKVYRCPGCNDMVAIHIHETLAPDCMCEMCGKAPFREFELVERLGEKGCTNEDFVRGCYTCPGCGNAISAEKFQHLKLGNKCKKCCDVPYSAWELYND
jgi:hypothetical protein